MKEKHPDKKFARRRNDIWKRLNENLQHVCNSELCLLEKNLLTKKCQKNKREIICTITAKNGKKIQTNG